MSMRENAVHDYGIVLDDILDDDTLDYLVDSGEIDVQFSFTGDVVPLDDNGDPDWPKADSIDCNTVHYLSVPKSPGLFSHPYKDMEDLLAAMRAECFKVDELADLSTEQIRNNLSEIIGTYYG